MTNKEKEFLSRLLEMASDEFSNHGCNDVPDDMLNIFTDTEKKSLIKEYQKYNNDPDTTEDSELLLEDFDCTPDWAWMSFFAQKLRDE